MRGSESGKFFITFVTRNTLRECPLMGYNFRIGRVVLNDPLKVVVIDIVGRVVENYQKPLDTFYGRSLTQTLM